MSNPTTPLFTDWYALVRIYLGPGQEVYKSYNLHTDPYPAFPLSAINRIKDTVVNEMAQTLGAEINPGNVHLLHFGPLYDDTHEQAAPEDVEETDAQKIVKKAVKKKVAKSK